MPSWKERLEAATSAPNKVAMGDADFTARKVLRGLGWSEAKLPLLCSCLSCEYSPDEPRIDAVRRVLDFVSGGAFGAMSPTRRFVLDVRNGASGRRCWNTDADLVYMCEVAKSVPGALVVCTRVKSKEARDEGLAFVFARDDGEVPKWLLQPVSTYMARENGCMVWRRKTDELFRDMAECLRWNVPAAS